MRFGFWKVLYFLALIVEFTKTENVSARLILLLNLFCSCGTFQLLIYFSSDYSDDPTDLNFIIYLFKTNVFWF